MENRTRFNTFEFLNPTQSDFDILFSLYWTTEADLPVQWHCFKNHHEPVPNPGKDADPEALEAYKAAYAEENEITNKLYTIMEAKDDYMKEGGYNAILTPDEKERMEKFEAEFEATPDKTKEQFQKCSVFINDLLQEPNRRYAETLYDSKEDLENSFNQTLDGLTNDSFQWYVNRLKRNYKARIESLKAVEDPLPKEANDYIFSELTHNLNRCKRTYNQALDYTEIYLSLQLYAAKHAPDKFGEDTLNNFYQAIDRRILSWGIKPGKRSKQIERESSERIIHLAQDEMMYTPINHITREYMQLHPNKRNTNPDKETGNIEVYHNDIKSIWTDDGFKHALSVTGKKIFTIIMAASKKEKSDTVLLSRDELADRCYIDISTKAKRDKFSRDLKNIVYPLGSLCIRSSDNSTAGQINYFSSTNFDGHTLRAVIGQDYFKNVLPKIPVSQTPESFFMMKGQEDLELILIFCMALHYTRPDNIEHGTNGTVKIKTLVEWGKDVFNTASWKEKDKNQKVIRKKGQEKRCADRYKKALNTLASVKLKDGKPDFRYEFYPQNSDESKSIADTTPEEFLDGKIIFSFASIGCADKAITEKKSTGKSCK